MTNLRQVLAVNIRKRRHILGYSQAMLAEKANTAPTYIAMIELEKKFPSVEMIERLYPLKQSLLPYSKDMK